LDLSVLRQFVPFSELSQDYLVDAIDHISLKSYKKGEMLFKRGRVCSERYYLLDGNVDLIDASFTAMSIEAGQEQACSPLNSTSPTYCSAVAKSVVKVFTISAEALDRIITWSQSADTTANIETHVGTDASNQFQVVNLEEEDDDNDWMSALLQSPLFSHIPLSQVQELFSRFQDVHADNNDIVIKEGERGDCFYVLAEGYARVIDSSQTVNIVVEPGGYFGEEALLGNTLRNATVNMISDGVLKRLSHSDFQELLQEPVLKYLDVSSLEALEKQVELIDVKLPIEFRINHMPGSSNIPLSRLRGSFDRLSTSSAYVVVNDAGSRAKVAAHLLCQAGFDAYILKDDQAAAMPESSS